LWRRRRGFAENSDRAEAGRAVGVLTDLCARMKA
jgi:hypothetical protein